MNPRSSPPLEDASPERAQDLAGTYRVLFTLRKWCAMEGNVAGEIILMRVLERVIAAQRKLAEYYREN